MDVTEKDGNGITRKKVGWTLEQALELTGFGWYNYLVVAVAGINVLGNFCPMMIFSYIVPATDCDLKLTVSQKGLLSSVIFTGMILTTPMFGYLADEYGRKYVATICNMLSGLLTLVSAFCPNFTSLVIITFINGAVNAGVLMPTYVYVAESTALKHRPMSILLSGAFGYTATMFLPLLAIFTIPLKFQWDVMGFVTFNSWRLLLLLASITPMIGSAMSLLFLNESPKYLLAKGRTEDTLEALRFMYRLNNRGSRTAFPVEGPIRLDANEMESESGGKASFKRIGAQAVLLFKKPLRKITIISCLYQAGLNGACNLMFVRLAQLTAEIRSYARDHAEYGVTFCEVMQRHVVPHNSSMVTRSIVIDSTPVACGAVPVETYYIAAATGLGQVCFFIISGPLTRCLGNKTLLVIYTFSSVVFCLMMVFNTSQLLTILCMTMMCIMLETSLPISVSILMEHFPTSVRSTASCLSLAFGRVATTLGIMIMAELQTGYCDFSYYGLCVVIIGLGILAQTCIKGTPKIPDLDFHTAKQPKA